MQQNNYLRMRVILSHASYRPKITGHNFDKTTELPGYTQQLVQHVCVHLFTGGKKSSYVVVETYMDRILYGTSDSATDQLTMMP